jgi:hypothetical protein
MRIIKSRNVIVLGRTETKIACGGGPDGYEMRRHILDVAKRLADRSERSVEIYAAASAGGWMYDQIQPEWLR